ncbi:MAG: MBL fold metallo-hydrolase [Bilifractor sp.]|jgi:phosphoribosyl 1,2-cyclic phosphodiesterase
MRVCSIASGSSGNCIFAGSGNTQILIDVGISGKKVEKGLNRLGLTGSDLNAIFVTHEHSDHIKGLGVMARRLSIPIYATAKTREAILSAPGLGTIPEDLFHEVSPDETTSVGDITVEPFRISHDAADPVGYRISHGKKSAAIATDMGMYTDYTISHLQNLDVLFIEANHDVRMLQAGRYPYILKRRILSERGHLSNEDSGRLVGEVLHDRMKYIVLSHLSKENNYPALAFETVSAEVTMGDNPYRAGDFPISVAKRDEISEELVF